MKKILVCLIIVTLFSTSNADMHQMYSQEDVLKKFVTSHQLFIEKLQKMPVPDNGTFYPVEDVLSTVKLKLQKPAFMNSPSGYLLEPDNKMSNDNLSIYSGVIPNGLHTMSEVVLLPIFPTPIEMGYSYFNPSGNDPSYVINSPGTYHLGSGFATRNESAIVISSPNVILDGNGHKITGSIDGIGVNIERSTLNVTVKDFFGINNFDLGIKDISFGSKILNNSIGLNFWSDIYSGANYSQIQYNTFNGTPYNFYGSPRNAVISDNNLEDISLSPGELYLIGCDNVTVTRNHLSSISSFGGQDILVQNNSFSSDSGITSILMTDKIKVIENSFNNFVWLMANQVFISDNSVSGSGLHDQNVGLTIYGNGNLIRKNEINNCYCGIVGIGAQCSIIDNTIEDTGIGMSLISNTEGSPGYTSWTIFGNKIINSSIFGLEVSNLLADDKGSIYNNFFASPNNICGDTSLNDFFWTNPSGPQLGTNIMGGPYIAGNYWSNPEGNGWSDLEPATITGYTTEPYEVITGTYDIAPLVRVLTLPEVLNIYPSSAPAGSTIAYLLTGNNFIDGAIVNLTHPGESNLTSVGSLSGIDLTGSLFIPSSAVTGQWNVSVNQNGQYSNDNVQFIINPALPVITNLNPGGAVQNTHSAPFPVIITGTGFDTVSDTSGVTVDGSAISYTIESPTRINALFPEMVDNILGNHPVIVTGISGPSVPYNFVVSDTGYAIDASSDGIGWISPSGMFSAYPGESITIQYKPSAGARIKNLTVNDEIYSDPGSPFTIPAVDRDYTIRLNNEPLSGVIIPAFTVSSEDGYTVTFTDASWGEVNVWKWDFGDRTHGAGNPIQHTYAPGTYTVSLWARNDFSQSQVVMGDIIIPMSIGSHEVQFFGA